MQKRESRKELLNYIEELKRRIDQLLDIRAELEANNSDLARKLSETERKLSGIELYNGTAKEAALPKCENEMCMDCIHCVTRMVDGQKRIVGCRKDIDCAGYMPKPEVIPVPYPLSVPPLPDYNSWTIMNSAARMMNGRLV